MPLFNWLRDEFHLRAITMIGLGTSCGALRRHWLPVSCCCARRHCVPRGWPWWWCSVALGISALYELIEWGAAMALGEGADAFLATQGDVWDTQKDMAMAGGRQSSRCCCSRAGMIAS